METIRTRSQREIDRRRKANSDQAIRYFSDGLPNLPTADRRDGLRKIRASKRPMRTAKALVNKGGTVLLTPQPQPGQFDLAAAQEARAEMIRKQPEILKSRAAYEDELGELEGALAKRQINQKQFNSRCHALATKPPPDWMASYEPNSEPEPIQPIERVPSAVLYGALGISPMDGSQGEHPPELPAFLGRRKFKSKPAAMLASKAIAIAAE